MTQVQYRNATYFGSLQHSYQRSGTGMLILDNSSVLVAQFSRNRIHGSFIFLSDVLRAYGSMADDRLDGYCILSEERGAHAPNNSNITIYGTFRNSRLYGKCVVVSAAGVTVGISTSLLQILHHRNQTSLHEVLKQCFPQKMYTVEQHLLQFTRMSELTTAMHSNNRFFGYFDGVKYFGFLLKEGKFVSVGEHTKDNGSIILEGIGRLYTEDHVLDGVFKNNLLVGVGVVYAVEGNRYTVGERGLGERGVGFPAREVAEIRKEFHLRSIHFYNDIVLIGLGNQAKSILMGVNQQILKQKGINSGEKYVNTTNSKVSNGNLEPLHSRLQKYEQETDLIEESSPIRMKQMKEYVPIERKKYFQSRFTQEQPKNSKEESRVEKHSKYNQEENKYLDSSYKREGGKQMPIRNTYNEKNNSFNDKNATNNQRNSSYNEKNPSYNEKNSSYNQRNTSAQKNRVKDTKEFLNELQAEERKKKLDLDKIYREAGLYKKK